MADGSQDVQYFLLFMEERCQGIQLFHLNITERSEDYFSI